MLGSQQDSTCGEVPEGDFFIFFFNATVVSKDSQCSERITAPGGFNINNSNPHALHTSWSSHPKEFSYHVNRNKHSFSRVHLQHGADVLLFRLASLDSVPYWQCWNGKIPARASFGSYIMFNSPPMGLAAGKTVISMHLMNYTKWDLAAVTVGTQDGRGSQDWNTG